MTTSKRYMPGVRRIRRKGWLPVSLYDTALTQLSYGGPMVLGDLFNDIMGAIVPGWESRPDWMKKIQIKPDPNKLVQAAVKVAPQTAPKIIGAAEQAGLNVYVQTPTGAVPVTPWTAELAAQGYGLYTRTKTAIGEIPGWVWLLGGGVLLIVLMPRGRR